MHQLRPGPCPRDVHCADREDVHCADREDVHCADREDVHCADSHTPIHEGIHTGERAPKAPAPLCGGGAKRRFLHGWVCGCLHNAHLPCLHNAHLPCLHNAHLPCLQNTHLSCVHNAQGVTLGSPRGHFFPTFFDICRIFSGMFQECSQDVQASSKGLPATF